MKIPNELNNILRSTHKGSIVALADDISRFYSVKRLLKKQCIKNILTDSSAHAKQVNNQIIVLFNTFGTNTNVVFSYILEDDELEVYHDILFVLKLHYECLNEEFCKAFNSNVNNNVLVMVENDEKDIFDSDDD